MVTSSHQLPQRIARAILVCLAFWGICGGPISIADQPDVQNQESVVEKRMVWVLTEQAATPSEGGHLSSETSAVIPYEVSCSNGHVRSAQRSSQGLGVYGATKWTIRVDGAPSSPEGAQHLQAALEHICTL
jgi:hypothetical protein